MLLLGSKTLTIDGITVFFDHADPSQFWYLPGPPRLGRRALDQRAAFTFIKYKPAAVAGGARGGGFVTFEVNLRLDPEQERRILSKLSSVSRGRPRLAVVPFDEGTVQCIALNLQGAGGAAAAAPPEGAFNAVEKILGASVPSLNADNTAAFSLTLSQEGATILEEAFEKGTTPIGVIYDLKYTGMRPALDVTITADFKRLYDHFSAGLAAQVYFVEAGIEAGFEKLVQDGVIKIVVHNFTGDADLKEKEKWALDFFKDNLLADWFRPTLTPGQLAGGIAQPEPLSAVLQRGTELRPPATPPLPPRGTNTPPPASLGPSPTAGIGPPDEHADPFAAAARMAQVNSAVSAAGSPATPATGTPAAGAPAAGSPAAGSPAAGGTAGTPTGGTPAAGTPGAESSPTAGLSIPPVPTPVPVTPGRNPLPSPQAASALSAGGPSPALVSFKLKMVKQEELKSVTLRYEVSEAAQRTYAPQGFFGLLMADLDKANHFIEVDLDDPFFRVFSVSVEAPVDFAKIGLQSVQIAIDYDNPADAANHKHADFVFDATRKDPQKFDVFMNQLHETTYQYSVQYHFDPGSEWEGKRFSYTIPAQRTEDRTLLLNPYEHIGFLELRVRPHRIDAGAVEFTEVLLTHAGPDGTLQEKTIVVHPDSPEQLWRLRLEDPAQRTVSYAFTHHLKDGSVRQIAPQTTKATTILVDDPFEEAIDVEFIPALAPGAFRQVFVDVEYKDDDNSYQRSERLTLQGNAVDIVQLRLSIIDPSKRTFSYRLTFIGMNGQILRNPFVTTEDTFVAIAG